MTGKISDISIDEFAAYLDEFAGVDKDLMMMSARLSNSLYAGTTDGKLLCVLGLIPPTLLSDIAYIWCYTTPLVERHRTMFGRHAFLLMQDLRQRYPIIVGYCTNERSKRWLTRLGATLKAPMGDLTPFEITT